MVTSMALHTAFRGESPTVLITGAACGIGRATALRLARDGWCCVLVDSDAAALGRLQVAWPSSAPKALTLVADLTDAARIECLAEEIPPLDALINNAGISAGGTDALSGRDDGTSARLLALNLAAPARVVRACAPRLKDGVRIVNLASGAGLRAIGWRGLYSPSKAGLIAQTQALALAHPEWTVTALSPGFVRTELVQGLIDSGKLDFVKAMAKVPLGRMAEPEEVAEALSFLVSQCARPLAGQLLVLDGGSSVVGGSQPLPAREYQPLPVDLPLNLCCVDVRDRRWRAVLDAAALESTGQARDADLDQIKQLELPGKDHPTPRVYAAVLNGAALDAPPGGVLDASLDAARRFRANHTSQASLTLLIPSANTHLDWTLAGDLAATRMLVATLAAEWGARGLRINALQWSSSLVPRACVPLIHYLAGARAQYLTGQILQPSGATAVR